MHEYTDKKCEHELQHCTHCDVVFCEKCKTEWQPKITSILTTVSSKPFESNTWSEKKDTWYPGNSVTLDAASYSPLDWIQTTEGKYITDPFVIDTYTYWIQSRKALND